MQYTGSYQIRGAYYKISNLSDEQRKKGLITVSMSNHERGVAYAAKLFNAKVHIVMPIIKTRYASLYGAEVILHGEGFANAYSHACELAEERGWTFLQPINDEEIIVGQGTIALEILKELPTVDYIIIPIGEGSLIWGVSMLAKLINSHVEIIGVELAGANCRQQSSPKVR